VLVENLEERQQLVLKKVAFGKAWCGCWGLNKRSYRLDAAGSFCSESWLLESEMVFGIAVSEYHY
jgi:hypothetical protein